MPRENGRFLTVTFRDESRQHRNRLKWNQQLVDSSHKMMKLTLVMMFIWIFVVVFWIGHLIIKYSLENPFKNASIQKQLFPRSLNDSDSAVTFENTAFVTVLSGVNEDNWKKTKTIIGSFHQLKRGTGKVPFIYIHFNSSHGLSAEQFEESDFWHRVSITSGLLLDQLKFLDYVKLRHDKLVWFSSSHVFEPVALELKKAALMTDPQLFTSARAKGRETLESMTEDVVSESGGALAGVWPTGKRRAKLAKDYGLIPIESASQEVSCHVDLIDSKVKTGASLVYANDAKLINQLESARFGLKTVAVAVPTTSKGSSGDSVHDHVLLKTLLPSLKQSIRETDVKVVVFVGFDIGDEKFSDFQWLGEMKKQGQAILGPEIPLVFVKLKRIQRVAMTWNMIFALARRFCDFDYFYQVNDDLTIVTSGWLSRFIEGLKSVQDIGVAGPSDSFNGFSCSLLTQAFVSRRHFEIFSGLLYPLEFRDWKSDRWISFVYGEERTFCWPEIVANNGAVRTRYNPCAFASWRVQLEEGQRTLSEDNKFALY